MVIAMQTPNDLSNVLLEVGDNVSFLSVLLDRLDINVNFQDSEKRTMLLKSINLYRSDAFILYLLRAGCDINIPDKYGETPLYSSMTRPTITVAQELIKGGANVNVQTKTQHTALHQAVFYDNLEGLCLLLYHGANPNIVSQNFTTPFMNALSYRKAKVSEALLNYYDSDECIQNLEIQYTALYYAMQCGSSLAKRLINMGADINYTSKHAESLLYYSLFYESDELFKLLWCKCDLQNTIFKQNRSFLMLFFESSFSNDKWLECLYLMLESSHGFELIQHHKSNAKEWRDHTFLKAIFKRKELHSIDRINIIYIFLTLGGDVEISDIILAYELLGFNKELEVLLYFLKPFNLFNQYKCKLPILYFIIEPNEHENVRVNEVFSSIEKGINKIKYEWFGYFSKNYYSNCISTAWIKNDPQLENIVKLLPTVPSLLELCRSATRKYICKFCEIKTPYEFHDIIKSLHIPQQIKDVLRFKESIYNIEI